MKVFLWQRNGFILSGVSTWMWRTREMFKNNPDIEVKIVNLLIVEDKTSIQLQTPENFFDETISSFPQFIAFLKKNSDAHHIVNFAFDYLEIIINMAPQLLSKLKLIGTGHSDEDFYYKNLKNYGKYWFSVMTVSDTIQKKVQKLLPKLKDKTFMVPYFNIPIPENFQISKPSDKLKVLYFGRIEQRQKRVLDFIPLASKLAGKPIHFTIIGNGPEKQELVTQLEPYKDQVTFIDSMPPWEIKEELTKHDINIMVSDYEGNSVALIESMVAGMAPFLTKTESGQDHLKNGENAVIVPIGDMDAMAERLIYYSEHKDELMAIKKAAHETAKDLIESFHYREKFLQLFQADDKPVSANS